MRADHFVLVHRLSYSKNGVVRVDGFSVPELSDEAAVRVWTTGAVGDREEKEEERKRRKKEDEESRVGWEGLLAAGCRVIVGCVLPAPA